ncbi:MAG: terminase large subunit [Planctomycetota bacterium]|nr:terminase large subunit [Planctomycetota bacterium]
MTSAQFQRLRELRYREISELSANSLESFLANIVIDSRPIPFVWSEKIDRWQVDHIIRPIIPAIEKMAGLRQEYTGPRSFFYVLPRGHDKTGVIGRLTSWACAYAKHSVSATAAAADKDQAGLLLKSINSEIRLNPWLSSRLKQRNWSISGPGGDLDIISSDVGSSSGLKCDLIVCDEITWWKNRDLFDVLYSGREKRPDSVFVVITNAGMKGSWQHGLLQLAKDDPEDWYVYEAPPNRTLASWMTREKIEKMRRMLARGIGRRVLDNLWIDATEMPLLTEDLILPCEDPNTLWVGAERNSAGGPFGGSFGSELYMGYDVGRTNDLSVCWTIELKDELAWTRELAVLDHVPLRDQEAFIRSRLNSNVVKCNIDMGGIGYQLAESLAMDFPGKVEGVGLSSGRQGQIGTLVKKYFEDQKIRIPKDDEDLRADLQKVSEYEVGAGGTPIIKTERDAWGHADRFWAMGLALAGLPIDTAPRYHRPPQTYRSRHAGIAR